MTMSSYVTGQYKALGRADSITVDPHKGGYIPYPAGGLCYRNSAMRNLVSFTAPGRVPRRRRPHRRGVRGGGLEAGRRGRGCLPEPPGREHRPERLRQDPGPDALQLEAPVRRARHPAWQEDDPFIVEFIQRLPAVRAGKPEPEVRKQLERIRTEIVERTNEEILADKGAMTLFRELGSDQNIVSYAFNFLVDGKRNQNVGLLNDLNQAVFTKLSLGTDPGTTPDTKMFVTSSDLDPTTYGAPIVDDFRRRLGVTGSDGTPIGFLISTTMDPWLTDTATAGTSFPTLMQVMRETVLEAIDKIGPKGGA